MKWLKRDIRTVVVAVVAASVTAGAPAFAHGVHAMFAHNADKVDGKHAVAATASLGSAAGKLVAHNAAGLLSSKFIPAHFAPPRAYAVIGAGGGFHTDTERHGITTVDHPGTGVYCLTVAASTGIDVTTAPVMVSVEWGASSGSDLLAFWQGNVDSFGCPAGQIEVRTYRFSGGLVLSDQVAFAVAVL